MYTQRYGNDGECIGVQRLSDGACIPMSERNADWRAFQIWNDKQASPLDVKSPVPNRPSVALIESRKATTRLRDLAAKNNRTAEETSEALDLALKKLSGLI